MAEEKYSLAIGTDVVCRILDIAPEAMLARAGLSHSQTEKTEVRVTSKQYFAAWNAAAQMTDRPEYLLHLGVAMARGPIIPVFFALTCAANLETGAARLAHYKSLLGPTAIRSFWSDGAFHVEFQSVDPACTLPSGLAALHLIVFLENIRKATAHLVRPIAVFLEAPESERSQVKHHTGIEVEQAFPARLSFSTEDARRRFISENPAFWSSLEEDLNKQMLAQKGNLATSERVRSILFGLLSTGRANADNVCVDLGLSRSTLQRRLRGEGTTLREILQMTRKEVSVRYLKNTDLRVQEISAMLGYSDSNSFTRSFRRWTGISPESFRTGK